MLQKSKAIALHSVKYGESSLIVYLYTLDFGRVTLLVNKAFGSGKVRNKAIYFQPLSLLDVVFYPGKNHGVGRLKEVTPYSIHSELQFQETKRAIALFVGELVYRTVREEEANATLYGFLENSIQILDVLDEGVPNFHLVFVAQFTKHLGFHPNGKFTEATPIFDYKNGIFVQTQPQHPMFFTKDFSKLLSDLVQTNYTDAKGLKLNHKTRNHFIDLMLNYYTYHMESVHGIKSPAILAQVFQP